MQRQKEISHAVTDDRKTDWTALNQCFAHIIGINITGSEPFSNNCQ